MEFGAVAGVRTKSSKSYTPAFVLMTSLCFCFGLITCFNDILVPHLRALFQLNYTEAALVQFCFFSAYLVASLPAGKLVSKLGYQRGTILGILVTASGCLLFSPAAEYRSYPIFLLGAFILACGITLIQVTVNPYVAALGPAERASARLTLAQAFNSLGTTLAPIAGGLLIFTAGLHPRAEALQHTYGGLAVLLIILAAIVARAQLPAIEETAGQASSNSEDRASAWKYRHLVLGAAAIFCYVGAEVAIGTYFINFIGLPEISGFKLAVASELVSLYWGGAMLGRFIGAGIMRKVAPAKVLAFNAFCATGLVLSAILLSGHPAMYALLAVGLFNSIMFPVIFSLAIGGLGKNTAQGSGILCMAIVGGAIVPLLQGRLADIFGLHHSYILPIACYLFIAYYGLRGYAEPNSRIALR